MPDMKTCIPKCQCLISKAIKWASEKHSNFIGYEVIDDFANGWKYTNFLKNILKDSIFIQFSEFWYQNICKTFVYWKKILKKFKESVNGPKIYEKSGKTFFSFFT